MHTCQITTFLSIPSKHNTNIPLSHQSTILPLSFIPSSKIQKDNIKNLSDVSSKTCTHYPVDTDKLNSFFVDPFPSIFSLDLTSKSLFLKLRLTVIYVLFYFFIFLLVIYILSFLNSEPTTMVLTKFQSKSSNFASQLL